MAHTFWKVTQRSLLLWLLVAIGCLTAVTAAPANDPLDILDYQIDAEIIPAVQTFVARVKVTMDAARPMQSVVFEFNGALEVKRVLDENRQPLQFTQDRLRDLDLRIALPRATTPGTPFVVIVEYVGQLLSAEGGVLSNKRLAYVGTDGTAYLLYGGRWFPFHGYAADAATFTLNLTVPDGLTVVGYGFQSKQPATGPGVPSLEPERRPEPPATPRPASSRPSQRPRSRRPGAKLWSPLAFAPPGQTAPQHTAPTLPSGVGPRTRWTFASTRRVLFGNFAVGRYQTQTRRQGDTDVCFYTRPGNEARAAEYAAVVSEALARYEQSFGRYAFGPTLNLVEIDDESLEASTSAGVTLLAGRVFQARTLPRELLCREVAFQWWGQGVLLRSFDDAWLSQGLATYAYILVEETRRNEGELRELVREVLERALAFESQASLRRAPAELDDQSAAYRSIMFYKGAFVFRMLRGLLGDETFFRLLTTCYTQYLGQNLSLDDFENLTNQIAGQNMRWFFALWVDSTGVPEFVPDYKILRIPGSGYRMRGTLEQNLEGFRMPVDIMLEAKGGSERVTLQFDGREASFTLSAASEPRDLIIDPDIKILQISDELRVAVVVRRGIQHIEDGEFAEAQQQFEAAIRVNRRSSWAWYNLGLLYLRQRNYEKARDAFDEALDGDLRPRWVEAWAALKKGNAYDALGQRDRAVAEYKKVIELGDDAAASQQAQRYLEQPYRSEP
ncbi:MAG: M1 family aminopeptidase [Chloracidobacterium sp.]|nr:M1 family aminopeptidase [Chloracidobacterium sp.]MDW8218138.1 M1 family aminopeptidase [Acidobacteriota bacterium]